jgi:glycosyltransferase involved in cell wall biosynthesis
MHIALVADPIVPVPPRGYGGSERIVALLCEGLLARRHAVTLLAGPGSETAGRLFVHHPPGRAFRSRAFRKILFQPLSLFAAGNADVIHNFGRLDYLWALRKTRIPLVHTFENPIHQNEVDLLANRRSVKLVSISDEQRRAFNGAAPWRTVFNAVDIDRLPFVAEPSGEPYLAFLGRLIPNKGVHLAIQVARELGMKLRIAGNVSTEQGARAYFETQVKPELGGLVEWIGEIGDAEKAAFLGHARALLFPIQWDEPFGIVVAEALSCGTPVIAFRRGSMPELIEDGVCGFLCDSLDEMKAAITKLPNLRRIDCRRVCEEKMSADHMVEQYVEIYRELCRAKHT